MQKRQNIALIILVLATQAAAQYGAVINPANIGDPRVLLANPASLTFANAPYVLAGYQNMYVGLADPMSSTMAGFVYPAARYGAFGFSAQNYQASLLNRSSLDFRYAYRFESVKTSIGINVGSLMTSYDRNGFQLVDMDDPLLSGDMALNTFNLGLGVAGELPFGVRVGMSLDHLNRPSTALDGSFQKDIRMRAGLVAEYGDVKPMFMWEHEDEQQYVTLGAEYWFTHLRNTKMSAMARAFVSPEQLTCGAAVLINNIRLDYLFDYPLNDVSLFAGATHQFVAAYTVAATTPCQPPRAIAVVGQKILQVDALQNVPRIDADSPAFPVAEPQFEINGQRYHILNYNAHPFINFLFLNERGELDELSAPLLSRLVDYAVKHPHVNLSLTAYFYKGDSQDSLRSVKRAGLVANALTHNIAKDRITIHAAENSQFSSPPNDAPIIDEQRRIKIKFDHMSLFRSADSICTFDLSHSTAKCGWKSWLFGVHRIDENGDKKLVWHTSGKGRPPETILWNWPRSLTHLSDLNKTYFCTVRLEDKNGNVSVSDADQFYIQHQPSALPKKYVLLFEFDSDTRAITAETQWSKNIAPPITLDDDTRTLLNAIADFEITGLLDIEQIIGYTDTTGVATRNQNLSQQRAQAVHRYLFDRGAAIDRPPIGMGENPALQLFPSETPQGRWMNRRVEILVRPAKNKE